MRRSICPRHGSRHHESDEFVRAIFHDQTGRLWNRPGPKPANRGSAWWIVDSGESQRTGLRSAFALAEIGLPPRANLVPQSGQWNPTTEAFRDGSVFGLPLQIAKREGIMTLLQPVARALQ